MRRRCRYPSGSKLTEEQQAQKAVALNLALYAEVLVMGVGAYINNDSLTIKEMQQLGTILQDASEMAQDAQTKLSILRDQEDATEDGDGGGVTTSAEKIQ